MKNGIGFAGACLMFLSGLPPLWGQSEPALESKLENSSFEQYDHTTKAPLAWSTFGEGVQIETDPHYRSHGRFSAKLSGNGLDADGGLYQRIAANQWQGKTVRLQAMVRTQQLQIPQDRGNNERREDNKHSEAELWLEVYEGVRLLSTKTLKLTRDGPWRPVALSVEIAGEATELRLGARVLGKTDLWLDHLELAR